MKKPFCDLCDQPAISPDIQMINTHYTRRDGPHHGAKLVCYIAFKLENDDARSVPDVCPNCIEKMLNQILKTVQQAKAVK